MTMHCSSSLPTFSVTMVMVTQTVFSETIYQTMFLLNYELHYRCVFVKMFKSKVYQKSYFQGSDRARGIGGEYSVGRHQTLWSG